jgi:hypothetical protein
MNTIWRRLKYYGIGFGLGLIFLIFFFQNRGCTWLPSNRVKNTILDRVLVVSEKTKQDMEGLDLSSEDIIQVLNDGDVQFKKSDKNSDDKVYLIEKEGRSYLFTLPKESYIAELFIGKDAFNVKTSKDGRGKIIHLPNDENMVYPDSTQYVTCQQEELGLADPKAIYKLIKETGEIDFGKTNLSVKPKPEHYMYFVKEGDTIGFEAIWYKNKINITAFDLPFENPCKR